MYKHLKNIIKVLFAVSVVSAISCNTTPTEPALHTNVVFINESQHFISVDVDITPGSWCKIDDFVINPEERKEFNYEGHGVLIEKATILFDNKVTIVHELNQSTVSEEFRNICKIDFPWWEYKAEGPENNRVYYTYRFTDEDYQFASQQ
jgi:lipoprotein